MKPPKLPARGAGELFTRLLTDACANEAKVALKAGGPMAIQVGFQTLGQLAMQELMTDRDVAADGPVGQIPGPPEARRAGSIAFSSRSGAGATVSPPWCQRASFHHRPRRAPARSGRGARPAALGAANLLWTPEAVTPYECDGSLPPPAPAGRGTAGKRRAGGCRAARLSPVWRAGRRTRRGHGPLRRRDAAWRGRDAGTGQVQSHPVWTRWRARPACNGVRNLAISEAAAPHGLYYAPDPSSQIACTIGGNVAENAGRRALPGNTASRCSNAACARLHGRGRGGGVRLRGARRRRPDFCWRSSSAARACWP